MLDMVDEWCLEGFSRRVNFGQKECELIMGEISCGDLLISWLFICVVLFGVDYLYVVELYFLDQCECNFVCVLVVVVVCLECQVEWYGELCV